MLTIEEKKILRQRGFKFVDGRVADNGRAYYPALDGGGYAAAPVALPSLAVQIEAGTAGYHGTVMYREPKEE